MCLWKKFLAFIEFLTKLIELEIGQHKNCHFLKNKGQYSISWRHKAIWTGIFKCKEDIFVLNIVSKFHKLLSKLLELRERMLQKLAQFHGQKQKKNSFSIL